MPVCEALSDVRVLELSRTAAAAYCGRLLSALGSEVVIVESPEGHPLRREGPFPGDRPDPEASGIFMHLSLGKKSITLRVGSRTGRELLDRLLARAHVLVHDLPPEEAHALNMDPGSLRRAHPKLVSAVISYYGSEGPYSRLPGCELLAEAVSGFMSITGDPEREPLKCYGRLGEYQAGVHAAVAIVAALLARDVNGQGEAADVSIAESMTFLMGGPPLLAQMLGLVLRRNGTRLIGMGERHPYPSTLRPCRDGWVHAHVNYRYPELLAALVGDPWLASDEVLGAMSAHADEIDRRLDRWLANKSKWEAVEQAQSMRLPFTEVLDPAEVLEDRHGHHRSRHNFLTLRTRRLGDIKVVASPIKFGPRPEQVEPPPQLGEHNEEVFGGWLGLTDRELATLRQAGVI